MKKFKLGETDTELTDECGNLKEAELNVYKYREGVHMHGGRACDQLRLYPHCSLPFLPSSAHMSTPFKSRQTQRLDVSSGKPRGTRNSL